MTAALSENAAPAFRHEVLFYDGNDDFVRQLVPFVREGLAHDEAVLVVLVPERLALLRRALGNDARRVTFADMGDVGRNPARIIEAWHEFVVANGERSGVRGIGEPIHTARSAAEIAECQTHEALLNVAFDDRGPFRLVCPYDVSSLSPTVVRGALRTHPFVLDGHGVRHRSGDYQRVEGWPARNVDDLEPPAVPVEERDFDVSTMHDMRRCVARHASAAGFEPNRANEVVLAVNEIATNSVRHGGGRGHYRVWHDGNALMCDVSDDGMIDEPLVGRFRPAPMQVGGYGLWLANRLCDLVQIRSGAHGTTVRIRAVSA